MRSHRPALVPSDLKADRDDYKAKEPLSALFSTILSLVWKIQSLIMWVICVCLHHAGYYVHFDSRHIWYLAHKIFDDNNQINQSMNKKMSRVETECLKQKQYLTVCTQYLVVYYTSCLSHQCHRMAARVAPCKMDTLFWYKLFTLLNVTLWGFLHLKRSVNRRHALLILNSNPSRHVLMRVDRYTTRCAPNEVQRYIWHHLPFCIWLRNKQKIHLTPEHSFPLKKMLSGPLTCSTFSPVLLSHFWHDVYSRINVNPKAW